MKIPQTVKIIYIYLFSTISLILILIIIASVKLVNLGLKIFIFKKADVYYIPKVLFMDPDVKPMSEEESKKYYE